MSEPEQMEFHERVTRPNRGPAPLPVRAGLLAGTAALVVIGTVSAMGASPPAPSAGGQVNLSGAVAPGAAIEAEVSAYGFRGGLGRGPREITIAAINGSNLSLETVDGWTRTITVGSDTTITKAGETIALADLAMGDQIGFRQERQTDGTFTITAIHVVLPAIAGEVTAVDGTTITVTGKDGTTGTIRVDGDTTYQIDGETGALSDIEVGDFVVAEGSLRDDGSLDADRVQSGMRGFRGGDFRGFPGLPGRGFRDKPAAPTATPTPTESTSVS